MNKIRIALADDHEVVRQGLKLTLELEPDMIVVGEARNGQEALEIAKTTKPDVMLLDIKLGDIDGPTVCRRLLEMTPKTAVVMLTNYEQDELVFRSLVAGAKGYVIKDVELAELKGAIRSVHRGESVLDPKIAGTVLSRFNDAKRFRRPTKASALSDADITIMRAVSEGLTNREIAKRVHLSPHTVKDHIESICNFLQVKTRTAAVAEAMRRGLI